MNVKRYILRIFLSLFLFSSVSAMFACPLTAKAASMEELEAEREERKSLPIESNSIDSWPAGPEIGAESAILMDIDTGVILYSKNIHEELYPASTTKMLTCLIAMEEGNLDDMVKFSHDAVFSVPSDGSKIGMDVGQSITLEECLYGVMVGSANEVANAVGEHIAGSIDGFVERMNERADELGCTNSHFCNTNGLFDENHYTSAYDLALIASEFFKNEMLCKIGNTARYHFEPTATQPDDFYLKNKHELITGELPYKGIMGGKTGYTDLARQTLVTGCEQNGMRLVCVIMKEESPYQFTDTATLFDYGFSNFSRINVADSDSKYTINSTSFFDTENDVFGHSDSFLYIDPNSSIILPNQTQFSDTQSTVVYDSFAEKDKIAEIIYTFKGTPIGTANLLTTSDAGSVFHFSDSVTTNFFFDQTVEHKEEANLTTIFINVKNILLFICILTAVSVVVISIVFILKNTHFTNLFAKKQKRRKW